MAARVKVIETTIVCEVTFDANLPAKSVKTVSMTLDPLEGAQHVLQVPKNEAWVVEDVYIKDTADVGADCIVEFRRNGVETILKTDPVSTLLVSNPSRPRYGKKVLRPFDRLALRAINLAAIGAEAATTTFYVKIKRFVA